jgi:hypothetical protein
MTAVQKSDKRGEGDSIRIWIGVVGVSQGFKGGNVGDSSMAPRGVIGEWSCVSMADGNGLGRGGIVRSVTKLKPLSGFRVTCEPWKSKE